MILILVGGHIGVIIGMSWWNKLLLTFHSIVNNLATVWQIFFIVTIINITIFNVNIVFATSVRGKGACTISLLLFIHYRVELPRKRVTVFKQLHLSLTLCHVLLI